MANLQSVEPYVIAAAGATKSFELDNNSIPTYRITTTGAGAIVLVGNMVFQGTGTPVDGMIITFLYEGQVTIGANTLSFFGQALTASQALYKQVITCHYNGTAWKVYINKDNSSGNVDIQGTDIVAGTIVNAQLSAGAAIAWTKLASASASTRGHLLSSGANGVVTSFAASTSGNIIVGDGTDPKSVAMSGDATITSAGVLAIGAGKVTPTMLSFTLSSYLEVSRTFTSAEVLALYSSNTNTGIELLAQPGAGKYYEIVSCSAYNNYNSTTYAAGANLLNVNCNAVALWTFPNAFIEATTDTASQGTRVSDAIIALNTALMVQIATADPTTGNGTLTVTCTYRIVTV